VTHAAAEALRALAHRLQARMAGKRVARIEAYSVVADLQLDRSI
jgi:hypothetical protein